MSIIIPIYERSRKYGYVFWKKQMDTKVESFLGNIDKAEIWFENSFLGEKKIDWKFRRISVGYVRTRALSNKVSDFLLKFDKKGVLKITCQ